MPPRDASNGERIPVAILGATGAVGQRFARLLEDHPWFEVIAVAASARSAGRRYSDACQWVIAGDPPPDIAELIVQPLEPGLPARILFSALPSGIARVTEPAFAEAGYLVCSNASAYRDVPDVPLLIPEINGDHVALVKHQRARRGWSGLIVTSPNCTITGPALVLKPLHAAFGLRRVFMTSMQAASGAGYPGVASLDILGNVVPYVPGEEEKFQRELNKLLGALEDSTIVMPDVVVSAHANRVPVLDGHTVSLSVGFEHSPSPEEAIDTLRAFEPVCAGLPSSPDHLIIVRTEPDRPQPRRDRDVAGGMAVSVGRIRACPILDLRMTTVVHNTLRGAASGAVLNAELLVSAGYLGA